MPFSSRIDDHLLASHSKLFQSSFDIEPRRFFEVAFLALLVLLTLLALDALLALLAHVVPLAPLSLQILVLDQSQNQLASGAYQQALPLKNLLEPALSSLDASTSTASSKMVDVVVVLASSYIFLCR